MKGKAALVTGSTSGIGEAIARMLASKGTDVMLNGFGDPDDIEKLRSSIESEYGVRTFYCGADLSQGNEAIDLVNETRDKLGGIDILVNNAGIQYVAPVEEFPSEKWEQIIAINLSAAFYTIHAAMPYMKEAGWGRIINMASAHGLVASKGKAGYVAAKHGIVGLTKVIGLETATDNITCNAICPGWVLTPLIQKQIDDIAARDNISVDEARKLLLSEKQPALEFVAPSDIGRMVVYLCGEEAKLVTGTTISIDGGWTAQ